MDGGSGRNRFTVQGDYQSADQSFAGASDVPFRGANLLGRWEYRGRPREHAHAGVLRSRGSRRAAERSGFDIDTYDFDLQQSAIVGARHNLVWGVGRRYNDYHTVNNDLAFVPNHRTLELTNVFLQDAITLNEEWKLTAGIKFEDNSYSDWSTLPDLRFSWAPNDKALFWLAGSRAIRAPTPFDTDVQEFVGGQLFVLGDPDFKTEKVTAYELGYRGSPDATLSLNAAVFYNEYDDLRTIEVSPVAVPSAALGQPHGRQRLWFRSLGGHSAHAVVAPLAWRSHGAQATGVQRGRVAARGCEPGGQRSVLTLLPQVLDGSAALHAST